MPGTIYISIQRVDYDDYPLGLPTRIGRFESVEDAERWMEDSGDFIHGQWSWELKRPCGRQLVYIKDLLNEYMMDPQTYLDTRARKV